MATTETAWLPGDLKRVLGGELQVTLGRPRSLVRNIAVVAIGDSGIRIAVADDIECVEGIEAETDGVRFEEVEVLECGQVGVEVSWSAHSAVMLGSKRVAGWNSEGAGSIIHSRSGARNRGCIGAEPIDIAASADLERAIFVDAVRPVTVGVVGTS